MAKLGMQPDRKTIFQSEMGPRALRAKRGSWKIFSVLDCADAEIAKAELAGGADGLVLTTLASVEALRELPLHKFSIRNEAGNVAARALVHLVSKQSIDPARLDINFGNSEETFAEELSTLGFAGPFWNAHVTANSDGEELASIVLGLKIYHGYRHKISVSLSAGHNVFVTLAKFRAMRILWERLKPGQPLHLHGHVAAPAEGSDDHEHYMLRCVASCFGAGLGGADSISISPFRFDNFERRMVRNIQNILMKESHLAEVADAAAGAGYVETLTREFCDAAWEHFQS